MVKAEELEALKCQCNADLGQPHLLILLIYTFIHHIGSKNHNAITDKMEFAIGE